MSDESIPIVTVHYIDRYSGFPAASSETIPWLFYVAFPWLWGSYLISKCQAQGGEKILAKIWFEEKMHLKHNWNLVHLNQSKIPWLSLTLNKIPWLPRKKFLSLILPDAGNPGYWLLVFNWILNTQSFILTNMSIHVLTLLKHLRILAMHEAQKWHLFYVLFHISANIPPIKNLIRTFFILSFCHLTPDQSVPVVKWNAIQPAGLCINRFSFMHS